ncbi:very-long-chain enoyl-CoA reductase [Balamuthia mandrillaris]
MTEQLTVVNQRGKTLKVIDVSGNDTVLAVKERLAKLLPGKYPARQRLTLPAEQGTRPVSLDNDKTLSHYGLCTGKKPNTIVFKDLGPQVGWSTVFMVEYAGPLLIYLFFYLRPWFVYGDLASTPMTFEAQVACACWVGHYLKRELETIFVHRFSKGTMPLLNIFKNSGYYWGAGALVGYFVNHPLYTPPSSTQFYAGLACFVLFELGNLYCHIILRNLRPPGTRVRAIPRGFLFEFVSCPNYTCEIAAWISFSIMTQTLAAVFFTLVGAGQMWVWAVGKHKAYLREFRDYPRNRRILVPFVI